MVGINKMSDLDMINLSEYLHKMEAFKHSDEARQELLQDILSKYQALLHEHNDIKNDYSSERLIRRRYQDENALMQKQLGETHHELDRNAFVLALIDGDGAIFQDALLRAGANGGSEAASVLQHAIRHHLSEFYNNAGSFPIMVHIYVSLDKLAQKLTQVGLLKTPFEFRAFAQSFSVNQPLFSIIDVGQGKERADYRIKEMLRTFSDNPTCKHIIFGGCHDQGYLLNLDQYKHDQRKAERITLLETTASARGFAELPNFKKTRFDSVFRYDPLPENSSPVQAQVHPQVQPQVAPPQTSALAQPPAPVISPPPGLPVRQMSRPNAAVSPAPAVDGPPPVIASPIVTTTKLVAQSTGSSAAAPADASWATVGKTGANNGSISIASNNTNKKKKYIYYNEEGHRLDEPLPPRDRNAAEAIDKRRDKAGRNFCNNWHLSNGKCNNGDFCNFQHAPKLSNAELNALKYKARSIPCKRVDCENFDCYLGHQCSFERDQGYCPFPDNCKLKDTHGMDKTKYVRYDEEGNEEFARAK